MEALRMILKPRGEKNREMLRRPRPKTQRTEPLQDWKCKTAGKWPKQKLKEDELDLGKPAHCSLRKKGWIWKPYVGPLMCVIQFALDSTCNTIHNDFRFFFAHLLNKCYSICLLVSFWNGIVLETCLNRLLHSVKCKEAVHFNGWHFKANYHERLHFEIGGGPYCTAMFSRFQFFFQHVACLLKSHGNDVRGLS